MKITFNSIKGECPDNKNFGVFVPGGRSRLKFYQKFHCFNRFQMKQTNNDNK